MNQFDELRRNIEMQRMVAWQICERSEMVSQIVQEREKLSTIFFAFADKELQGNEVDLRAISGLLVSAINYITLHSVNTDSTICEIDVSKKEGMDRIKAAIRQILDWAYRSNSNQR